MTLEKSLSILTSRWASEGIEQLPPESQSRIEEVMVFSDGKVPHDVQVIYQTIGGMVEMDAENWRLWSLEEVRERNPRAVEEGVIFSDYLLDCYWFRLKRVDDLVSEVWVEGFDLGPPVRISRSIEEFFATYITEPTSVLNAPSR